MPFFPMSLFLPSWAQVHEPESADVEGAPPKNKKFMDMTSFLAAFDNFALVYAACGALEYTAAMGHKRQEQQLSVA